MENFEAPCPLPQVAALTTQQVCGNIFSVLGETQASLCLVQASFTSSRASITQLCFALLTPAPEVLLLGKELFGEQNLAFP